jgi:hypothetical protein
VSPNDQLVLDSIDFISPEDRYLLFYPERPWTSNAERGWHYYKRHKKVKEWREAFYLLAKQVKIPKLQSAIIHVFPFYSGGGRVADVAGCYPAQKAGCDGALIDTGILPDDSSKYVTNVVFHAPIKATQSGLALVICGKKLTLSSPTMLSQP